MLPKVLLKADSGIPANSKGVVLGFKVSKSRVGPTLGPTSAFCSTAVLPQECAGQLAFSRPT
jgi:hypothetical protein